MTLQVCAEPGCPVLTNKSHCSAHERATTPRTHPGGDPLTGPRPGPGGRRFCGATVSNISGLLGSSSAAESPVGEVERT